MASIPANHVEMTVKAVKDALPDDLESLHDYGARSSTVIDVWKQKFPNVRAFDMGREGLEYGDVTDPQADADVIATLHVLESGLVNDPAAAIDRLLDHCKYLLISVHRGPSNIEPEMLDGLEIIFETEVSKNPGCNCGSPHDITLLRGRL